ncbi:MAG: galactose-phosphate uridylyltransferase [Massilia sp.]|nr:galactose-phosphate uridylyltransferase [Massilia sp.]
MKCQKRCLLLRLLHAFQSKAAHDMYTFELTKPDGRELTLYSRAPIGGVGAAPSPFPEPLGAAPHFRWHPLRGEWVAYAAYRQNRTFQPPPEYNPLAATTDPAAPTELPAGDYDIAVFANRFPAMSADGRAEMIDELDAPAPASGGEKGGAPAPREGAEAPFAGADAPAPASGGEKGGAAAAREGAEAPFAGADAPAPASGGRCEVVVFTQDPSTALGRLPLEHIALLLRVWGDRTERAARQGDIRYVLPFENRGVEVGVTLHHPHGQIYAYPFVPPVPAAMLRQEAAYYAAHGSALLVDMAAREAGQGVRVLYQGEHAIAFVPACARYPYEVWVMPTAPVAAFADLNDAQRDDLARALKTVLLKYDGLWQREFPYLMAWYQAPLDGQAHPETQLHAEFFPPYRTRDRLKYLAGTEIAAGMFAMDALPEDKAAELQAVAVTLEAP